MKKTNTILLIMAIAITTLSACQTTPAHCLIERLKAVQETGGVIFGHHDDTAYGHTWRFHDGESDVKAVCGDYPGMMSWDLGMVEYDSANNLDGVPFDFIRTEIARQNDRGGINTISWHVRNPLTQGDSWDCSEAGVVKQCVTEGSALNDTLKTWLSRCADFIGSLRDDSGNRIGVIFRPWHEHTGSWFWWGYDLCSRQDYIALWQLTRKVFDERGIDNVVWAYSPDKDHVTDMASYLDRYPGDDYVDIMGGDIYHYGGESGIDTYQQNVKNVLSSAAQAAIQHQKLLAFSETGSESLPMPEWWTDVLLPQIETYPVCYVVVWRNAWDKPEHFYAPYPNHKSADSFRRFINNERILTAKDLKKIQ
ncbi:MAG: glycoside hydrolase family 26 protein [Muribaculaceae bacterium]